MAALKRARARGLLLLGCVLGLSGSARAGLELPGVPALPPAPERPYLWFDGASPSALASLVDRITDPATTGAFARFEAYVDGHLPTLAGADDETRSKVAKGAALLSVLGQAPPAGSGFGSYRDAAVSALMGMKSRQAVDTFIELFAPPPDAIDVPRDAARLQSAAEAYDMLRGSGVMRNNDDALRAKLAAWAEALRTDWHLVGASGVAAHRDSQGIKAGAALVTVSLAMPDHVAADGWRATGMKFLDESLRRVADATGWYGEGPWYLGDALANLVPCAWHVRHATGIDWFEALRPIVLASLAWRQPDGRAPPFEDGLPITFPWDVLASAYPDLAPAMLWAWEHSPRNDETFESQHLHDATRFILADLTSVASPPTGAVTRFLADGAHLAALRTSWEEDALMATMITARDFSTDEGTTARHNVRNPLDLVVHDGGHLVVPTAGGGPQVTASASRAGYLDPRSKNIPLIDGAAPLVGGDARVSFGDRLDSEDSGGRLNHYADLARTELEDVYAPDSSVARIVALVDRSYVVVMDRLRLPESYAIALSWRGRGTLTSRAGDGSAQRHSWAGPVDAGPRLDLDVVGTGALSTESFASHYADRRDEEEAIEGVLVGTEAMEAAFISVLQVGDAPARTVTPIGDATVAAARVERDAISDTLLHNLGDGDASVDGVTTDALAAFVRRLGGASREVALVRATHLELDDGPRLVASAPVTMALTPGWNALVAEISADAPDALRLELVAWPGLDPDEYYQASLAGALIAPALPGGRVAISGLGPGTLIIEPARCIRGSGDDPDGDRHCGAADTCPEVADDQTDSDEDGVGDSCECDGAATRCDDGLACTSDGCEPATGECTSTPRDGVACDDGDPCTSGDLCRGDLCRGEPLDCDDADPCTVDACSVVTGCTHEVAVGSQCDDGDACTRHERCDATGACVGVDVVCDDGNTCTREACLSPRGCEVVAFAEGAACDDGSDCTLGDRCGPDGVCGAVVPCDDGEPCTSDRCDPVAGCVFEAVEGLACQDGDRCTAGDRCQGGVCSGSEASCDDGNPCTVDGCDPTLGCQHAAAEDGVGCDDGNACTTGDACRAGSCRGEGIECDDADPCTVDVCGPRVGCVHEQAADGQPCDDGDACTDRDACRAGVCVGASAECDDHDACTIDRCIAERGCVSEDAPDGTACGEGAACLTGQCAAIGPGGEVVEVVEAAEVVEVVEAAEGAEIAEEIDDVEAVEGAEAHDEADIIDAVDDGPRAGEDAEREVVDATKEIESIGEEDAVTDQDEEGGPDDTTAGDVPPAEADGPGPLDAEERPGPAARDRDEGCSGGAAREVTALVLLIAAAWRFPRRRPRPACGSSGIQTGP